jgi:uncharacterized membrane protein
MRFVLAYALPAVIVLISVPMVLGIVPPNAYYGFRTTKTRSSREIWYPANRASGWFMILAALLALGLNIVLVWIGADWPQRTLFRWLTASNLVPLFLSLAASFAYLRRL